MRNIFDQYEQPENRLTHALIATLDQDRRLLIPFLRWLGVTDTPNPQALVLTEQQIPGTLQEDAEDIDFKGLPDAAVFDEDGWTVVFECKIQARVNQSQINRHRESAKRHGFKSPWVVVISVDQQSACDSDKTIVRTWREIYAWFGQQAGSIWAQQFVRYMQIFERKMLSQDYDIRGTITVFDGLRFDEDNPYTYREARRLIGLLGDMLQKRKDLHKIGVDPNGSRRPAITGRGADAVWDFLPLSAAREAEQFTSFPHLTIAINRLRATAAVTVPNGIKGGFRTKLSALDLSGFMNLIATLERGMRPISTRSPGAKPKIYVTQRHYRSQRSNAEVDASLNADLRTAVRGASLEVKYQPQWIKAIYELLVKKRSNIQLGVEMEFDYACPIIRSPQATDLFAESWKALSPLIDFVLKD